MRRRENFIWGFLIAVSIGLMFYVGINSYTTSKDVRKYQQEEAEVILGTDPQLLETVTSLERELKERLAFKFQTDKDPLKLSSVIQSPKLLAAMGYDESEEGLENMRLSLTIMGVTPRASIEYMGTYYDVKVGDKVGGHLVLSIEKKKVVVQKDGIKVVLYNRLKPETLLEQRKLLGETAVNF